MDYREQSFRTKFADAARELGALAKDVVSLKLRETLTSHSDYHDLLHALEHDMALLLSEARGTFQGRAHLVGDRHDHVVVVEHETGLEILFIAGSIASLVGLIPTILGAWRATRAGMRARDRFEIERVEVRRFDEQGRLREESLHGRVAGGILGAGAVDPGLAVLGHLIDTRVSELAGDIRSLATRVSGLEKQLAAGRDKKPRQRAAKKSA